MTKLLLLVAVTIANLAMVVAQTKHCGASYLTTKPDGTNEAPNDPTIACTVATVRTKCIGGYNPRCMLSLRSRQYICCFEVAATASTPDPGSTFPTPSVTVPIRILKPICPNNAIAWGGNSALPCNITNPAGGCPAPVYKCVKAVNVYDFYGSPAVTADDSGAALNPNVCCQTDTLTSYAAVFSNVGLTPNIIPTSMAPTNGIVSVFLTGPATKVNVFQGDDRSGIPDNLKVLDATTIVTLYEKTTLAAAKDRYHILFFDATTNKDFYFTGNIPGDGTAKLKFGAYAAHTVALAKGPNNVAIVYPDAASPLPVKPYKYAKAAYGTAPVLFGPLNTDAHRFVVLVWKTPDALDFGPEPTTAADSTKILLGTGPYGDFVPTDDTTSGPGKFTTVTAFLSGKAASFLKTPIAGTYFYLKN